MCTNRFSLFVSCRCRNKTRCSRSYAVNDVVLLTSGFITCTSRALNAKLAGAGSDVAVVFFGTTFGRLTTGLHSRKSTNPYNLSASNEVDRLVAPNRPDSPWVSDNVRHTPGQRAPRPTFTSNHHQSENKVACRCCRV